MFPLFLTTAYASAADLARKTGDASLLNKHQSRAHAIIGLALVLAPPLGAMIMSKTGNAKYPALAAVCVSLAHFVYMYLLAKSYFQSKKILRLVFKVS